MLSSKGGWRFYRCKGSFDWEEETECLRDNPAFAKATVMEDGDRRSPLLTLHELSRLFDVFQRPVFDFGLFVFGKYSNNFCW